MPEFVRCAIASSSQRRKITMTVSQSLLMDLNIYQITGLAGFFVYLFAFGAVQFDWLNGNSAFYSACNILAASLVAVSLIADFNLASALIQGSWIMIGAVGLIVRLRRPVAQRAQFQSTRQLGA
jgi:hypothetical protein